jgi:hypothetical protein
VTLVLQQLFQISLERGARPSSPTDLSLNQALHGCLAGAYGGHILTGKKPADQEEVREPAVRRKAASTFEEIVS